MSNLIARAGSDEIVLSAVGTPPMGSPGRATLKPPNSPRNWQEQQSYGQTGSVLRYTGDGLAAFDCEIYLWTYLQDVDWALFSTLFLSKTIPGTPPRRLGIHHPWLVMPPHLITTVVVLDVLGPERDEEGGDTWTIKFKEYRAPLPILTKPLPAIPALTKGVPTASDAADVELQTKLATAQALSRGSL
jgi:hypothetical protein